MNSFLIRDLGWASVMSQLQKTAHTAMTHLQTFLEFAVSSATRTWQSSIRAISVQTT